MPRKEKVPGAEVPPLASPPPAVDESADVVIEAEDFERDPLGYSYDGYDPLTQIIVLIRMEPAEYAGQKTRGYVGDIAPGMTEADIKRLHGGGAYRVLTKDRESGQIRRTQRLEVEGPPIVGNAPSGTVGADGRHLSAGRGILPPQPFENPVEVDINGVKFPWHGSLAEVQNMALFAKLIEQLFPPKVDINSALLEMVLKGRTAPDPLDSAVKLKQALDLFGSAEGAPVTGATGYDLIARVIEQAGGILQNLTAGGRLPLAPSRPMARPALGSPVGPALALPQQNKPTPPATSADTSSPTEEQENMEKPKNPQAFLITVVESLVKAFSLEPPKEPAAIVRMLDLLLPFKNPAEKGALRGITTETIFDLCELQLAEDWADPESRIGNREQFGLWFRQIVDLYCDPGPEGGITWPTCP